MEHIPSLCIQVTCSDSALGGYEHRSDPIPQVHKIFECSLSKKANVEQKTESVPLSREVAFGGYYKTLIFSTAAVWSATI